MANSQDSGKVNFLTNSQEINYFDIWVHTYIYKQHMFTYIYIYIYTHIHMERERERERDDVEQHDRRLIMMLSHVVGLTPFGLESRSQGFCLRGTTSMTSKVW